MAIDTNESLEMIVEADADAAGKELDELIAKLGEVIAQLKKVKSPSQQGLIPGLQDALGNIMNLRKQIAGLNIRRAKFSPDSKEWKKVDAQISEANYQLDKFVTTANDLIGKALVPNVDTSKLEKAVQDIKIHGLEPVTEDIPLYDGAISPPVKFDWAKFHADSEAHLKEFESFLRGFEHQEVEISVEFTSELAQAQKHVTALENAIERNKHNMRKFQIASDEARLKREAAALRTNESLLKRYEDAIRAASGAWAHMDDAGTIEIRNVEDFERVERAAKRLEKSIENDTAAMHRFSAANDAAGVERMKAKLEGSIVALDRYNKALERESGIGKQRDQMRQLQSLYADIERIQKRINTAKGGDRMFVNNTATVRRLKLEMLQAEMQARRLRKALGEADTGGAFRQSAKHIGLSLINMVKLRAEAKRGKKAFIDMSRALSLMAFRSAVRTVLRLTREGIQNLAKYSREVDNAFNGALSRMMSKVTELKNSFAAAIAPVIQAIEPYVTRVINFVITAFNNLSLLMASLFGQETFYKAIPVVEDYAESLDSAANSAKKLQKQLMGIDELTILQDPNAGGSGATPGKADPSEMFTIEKVADHQVALADIKKKVQEIMPWVAGVAGLFAAWKVANLLIELFEVINKLKEIKPLLKGLATVATIAIEFAFVKNATDNFLSEDGGIKDLIAQAFGTMLGAAALYMMWGPTGFTIGIGVGIVASLVSIATQIAEGGLSYDDPKVFIEEALLTAFGGIAGFAVGGAAGGVIGASIALALSFNIVSISANLSGQAEDGSIENAGNIILAALGTGLAGAGIGFVIGGPAGAAIGAVVGIALSLVAQSIGMNWGEIQEWFEDFKERISARFDEILNDPDLDMFDKFFLLGDAAICGLLEGMYEALVGLGTWLKENLVDPLVDGVKDLLGIQSPSKVFAEIGGYLIEGLFDGLFGFGSDVDSWGADFLEAISKWFSYDKWKKIGSDALDALWDGIEEIWKDLKSWWSDLELPEFKIKKPRISWSSEPAEGWIANVLSALGLPTSIPKLKVNWYGDGGFPSMGELFVARERGPELVGRMGSRNVVANNDQIVQGIAYGVAEANDALISVAYAVADRIVQAIADKDMNTYIDTKKITTAQQNRSRAYGV